MDCMQLIFFSHQALTDVWSSCLVLQLSPQWTNSKIPLGIDTKLPSSCWSYARYAFRSGLSLSNVTLNCPWEQLFDPAGHMSKYTPNAGAGRTHSDHAQDGWNKDGVGDYGIQKYFSIWFILFFTLMGFYIRPITALNEPFLFIFLIFIYWFLK